MHQNKRNTYNWCFLCYLKDSNDAWISMIWIVSIVWLFLNSFFFRNCWLWWGLLAKTQQMLRFSIKKRCQEFRWMMDRWLVASQSLSLSSRCGCRCKTWSTRWTPTGAEPLSSPSSASWWSRRCKSLIRRMRLLLVMVVVMISSSTITTISSIMNIMSITIISSIIIITLFSLTTILQVQEAYRVFDKDRVGYITAAELRWWWRQW